MTDHDRLFKELLTTFFFEFVDLFLPQVSAYMDRDSVEFLDKEIFTDVTSGEKHEVDIIAKVRFRDQDTCFLIHIENQAAPQADFHRRMFRYFARLEEKYNLPLYPIAVFSYDRPLRAEPNRYQIVFPDFTPLSFQFRVIQLNRLNWRKFINQPNPIASALMAKMKIARTDRAKVKLECLRLLATLKLNPAKMQLISGFVDTYLRLSGVDLQKFQREVAALQPMEKEQVMEIVTSWMEEGIGKGLEQGLQQESERIVLRLLNRRFHTISEVLEARVRSLSTPQREELVDVILDATELAQVEAWIDAQR